MLKLYTFSALLLLVGCGVDLNKADDTQGQTNAKKNEEKPQEDTAVKEPVALRGYVSSAFDLTVDGDHYTDSEDFYTAQLDKLEGEKYAGGYDDYKMTFDAKIGLNDLKQGMLVYIAGQGDKGYGAEATVSYNGTFEVRLPGDATGDTFNIRANKRIGVRLTGPEGEKVTWCYNFYAAKQMALAEKDKPIILREFYTKLTKYECQGNATDTINIPAMPGVPVKEAFVPSAKTEPTTKLPGKPVREAFPNNDPSKSDEEVVAEFNK